jgi:inward rectifier potassium channel
MISPFKRKTEVPNDLGFGAVVSGDSHQRLLNRDGSFNVERRGLPWRATWDAYEYLVETTWPRFYGIATLAYLLTHVLFALVYVMCGGDALSDFDRMPGFGERFSHAFFFSVHTLSTVGYGHVIPTNFVANLVMTFESLVGLFCIALITGLVFTRFSRPSARILFSRKAVVAPYRDFTGFMFRITNQRRTELIEVQAKVILSRLRVVEEGRSTRHFDDLHLERRQVTFFPLSWTIVHPIDKESPLHGLTYEDLQEADAEFLVLLSGIDETSLQTVHRRTSYKWDEVVWGARFDRIFVGDPGSSQVAIDVSRLHDIQPAELKTDG